MNRILLAVFSTTLAGCAVGPRYQFPKVAVPAQFHQATPEVAAAGKPVVQWWREFHDPVLTSLIERAAQANLDARIAALRVTEARAARGIAKSAYLPSINTSNQFNRVRGGFAQGVTRVNPGSSLIAPFETNSFQLGFDASYELDLFGGVRRSVEAATADLQAAESGRQDALLTVLGEVARTYAELRGMQRRIAITERNVATQKDTLDLTRIRVEAGLSAELDAERQAAQLSTTQAALPSLQAVQTQAIHRLSVLLGQEPGALLAEVEAAAPLPAAPPIVPAGLPSELLQRRPDLRQAEAEVAAATARVGVARSDLFPKFKITGLTGRQATDLGGFTLGGGTFFSAGPAIQLPIFNHGRIRSNIAVQDARLQQALVRYENAALHALEEVENALNAYRSEAERREKLAASVEASRTSVTLANELYARGLADFLSVLDAQREQYAAEDALAQSETVVVTNVVALFKALGGGWE